MCSCSVIFGENKQHRHRLHLSQLSYHLSCKTPSIRPIEGLDINNELRHRVDQFYDSIGREVACIMVMKVFHAFESHFLDAESSTNPDPQTPETNHLCYHNLPTESFSNFQSKHSRCSPLLLIPCFSLFLQST